MNPGGEQGAQAEIPEGGENRTGAARTGVR